MKDKMYIASLSGGKDSTAMVLRLIEEGMPLDRILFCDTGIEFPQMYDHINKLEKNIPIPVIKLRPEKDFEYYLLEYKPKRRDPDNPLAGNVGYSWADSRNRWCTAVLKVRVIDKYIRKLKEQYDVVQYVGIAADEKNRMKDLCYPLADLGMTEKDCLEYCYARGYHWDGLYEMFSRVSCWCCPLQPLEELRMLRKHFPELWEKLLNWQRQTWRDFRSDYSAIELDIRFQFEEERMREGKPIKGKAFFQDLRKRIEEKKQNEESGPFIQKGGGADEAVDLP